MTLNRPNPSIGVLEEASEANSHPTHVPAVGSLIDAQKSYTLLDADPSCRVQLLFSAASTAGKCLHSYRADDLATMALP